MAVIISPNMVVGGGSGYSPLPPFPLSHARIGIDSICTRENITASSQAAGYPAFNPASPWTNDRWKPEVLPADWTCDAGTGVDTNYIAIAGHNLATYGNSIGIDFSTDGTTWTELYTFQPAANVPIMILYETETARYFRVRVFGGSGIPEIGVIYIGLTLDMQRCISGSFSPFVMNYDTTIYGARSGGGQFTARTIQRQGVKFSADWQSLTADWCRQYLHPFIKKARYRPFFILWRPDLYPDEAAYVFTQGDVAAPTYSGNRNFMNFSISGDGWTDD